MSQTWFWTKSVARERRDHLGEFASFHGGFAVEERKEPGLFARRFPVATGLHRGRPVEIGFGPDGYNTRRTASATHTVLSIADVLVPAGLRVFPSLRGGFTAKGGARGAASAWMAHGTRAGLLEEWRARHGYVSLSDALGLRVHVAGVSLPPPALVSRLDEAIDLMEALERA